MIDATRGIEGQDQNIFSIIQKNKKVTRHIRPDIRILCKFATIHKGSL